MNRTKRQKGIENKNTYYYINNKKPISKSQRTTLYYGGGPRILPLGGDYILEKTFQRVISKFYIKFRKNMGGGVGIFQTFVHLGPPLLV